MINSIYKLLRTPDLFLKTLDLIEKKFDRKIKKYSTSIVWEPNVRWKYSHPIEEKDAFALLFFLWIQTQKTYCRFIQPENKGKSTKELLTKLFGTEVFADLELEEVKEQSLFQAIGKILVDDYGKEKLREKELKNIKEATIISIKCKTGTVLYFGKTSRFYFLITKEYIKKRNPPIGKTIDQILFADKLCESVRKRPGMFLGSVNKRGLYYLVYELVEELLKGAKEKIISLKLLSHNSLEIICESYSVLNNTKYLSSLAIASALGEFYEYQDVEQKIRTEKGVLISRDYKNIISKGIKLIWKVDCSIFENIDMDWDYFIILARMTELAALNPYIINLSDCRNQNKIYIPSGIEYLLKKNNLLYSSPKILPLTIVHEGIIGNGAICFSIFDTTRKSYVNNQMTQEGGTHVEGLLKGIKKALKRILDSYENSLTPEEFMKYLSYVIHIQVEEPRWYGNVKRKLKNIEVKSAVQSQVEQQVYLSLKQDIEPLKAIYPSLL